MIKREEYLTELEADYHPAKLCCPVSVQYNLDSRIDIDKLPNCTLYCTVHDTTLNWNLLI